MDPDNYSVRPINIGDALNYFLLVSKNTGRLVRFFPNTPVINKDVQSTTYFIENTIKRWGNKEFNCFVICGKSSQSIVGAIFLKNFDWNSRKCELSYFIDGEYEGQGIMTKAVTIVSRHCFVDLNLNKVFMRIADGNIASKRIAEKNGFELEGVLRKDYRTPDGDWVDLAYYGLLNDMPVNG